MHVVTFMTLLTISLMQSKVAMHHSKTPQDNKDNALSHNGNIHPEIATSTPGIEVKIPNIKRDVTFQEPENMESYLQEVGMGGRDGSDV